MDARAMNILDAFVSMREFDRLNAADYKGFPDAAAQFAVIDASIGAMQNHAATQTSGGARASRSAKISAVRRDSP